MTQTSGVRWWSLCFVSLFLMIGAWSLALPVNGAYDEKQHLVRAYAVASGQLAPAGTALDTRGYRIDAFAAPRSLLPLGTSVDCTWWQPPKPAGCQRWTNDRRRVLTPTRASRYSPLYYAVVGLPLLGHPDRGGIVLARLMSAFAAALLLGSAVWLALRSGRRLLAVAVVAVVTPTALDLAGAVNPNGLEIAAGILVGTALAVSLLDRVDRVTLWSASVGSVLLLTVRELGPLLLALVVAAAALLAGRYRIVALARRRDARWIVGGGWLVGAVYAAWWLLYSGGVATSDPPEPAVLGPRQLIIELGQRVPSYLNQMVAKFSYGEFDVSPVVAVCWYLMLGLVVVVSLRSASPRARLVVAGLGAACLGVLIFLDVYYLPRFGWFAQGRYAMPAAVAVLFFATVAGRVEDRRGRVAVAAAALTVPLHWYALAAVMTRFSAGVGAPLRAFAGSPLPGVGRVLPPVVLLAGAVLLWGTVLVAGARMAADIRAGTTPRTAGAVPRQRSAEVGAGLDMPALSQWLTRTKMTATQTVARVKHSGAR
jgi:hypothetical protein